MIDPAAIDPATIDADALERHFNRLVNAVNDRNGDAAVAVIHAIERDHPDLAREICRVMLACGFANLGVSADAADALARIGANHAIPPQTRGAHRTASTPTPEATPR